MGKARNEEKAVEHIKKLMANLDAEMICTVQDNIQELRSYVALPDEGNCPLGFHRGFVKQISLS